MRFDSLLISVVINYWNQLPIVIVVPASRLAIVRLQYVIVVVTVVVTLVAVVALM